MVEGGSTGSVHKLDVKDKITWTLVSGPEEIFFGKRVRIKLHVFQNEMCL